MRDNLAIHKDLAARTEKLETTQNKHGSILAVVVDEIKKLRATPVKAKRRIGFPGQAED
jgi:hypothetical protein